MHIEGEVCFDGQNIFDKTVDTTWLRKQVGMVFQKANPFPMSIYDNVAYGPRTHGIRNHERSWMSIVEKSLRDAAIWDEVKDRLKKSALGLSGGQQQRLCIARALANGAGSSADGRVHHRRWTPSPPPKIEDLAVELKEKYTVIMVTHNMQQAVRVSDKTAFFLLGELVEFGGHRQDLLHAQGQADRRVHYREVWIMREKFKQQLEEMYRQMVIMGSLCQQAIAVAVRTLDEEEDRAEKLEAQVFAVDGEIDDMEREIEALCTKLLLKQQPVAADLRRITAALKMVTDLERIGDQASDIAELARFIRKGGAHSHLKQMAAEVIRMVSESVDAFVRLDLDQAREVIAYDDVVDRWFDQIKKELVSQIAADSTAGEELLDVFLVAKYLERIGDHATNLAEWVEYALTGTRSKDGHWEAPDGE